MIQFQPLNSQTMTNVWIDVLAAQLLREIAQAEQGHCLRVSDLPRPVLEGLTARLSSEQLLGVEVYLVDKKPGPELWRVSVNKVVERRNVEENVVLSCFPPDVQLAAGDSVDISTFRLIPVADLPKQIEQVLMDRIAPQTRRWVKEVLDYLKRRGWPISMTMHLDYLATIAAQQSDDVVIIGAALYTLGLIPDLKLLDQPENFHYRLGQRNIRIVQQLQIEGVTPIGRVLQLPLSDDKFRSRLIDFLTRYRPEEVRKWGQIVVTDPLWQDLTLDRWPLGEESTPLAGTLRIDVELVNMPRRNDGLYLYMPTMKSVKVAWQTTPIPSDVPDLSYFRIELLSADRVVTWESPLIKNVVSKTARRSRTIKNLDGIDDGVYFFRVIALNVAGDPFPEQPLRDPNKGNETKRINETDDFLLQNTLENDADEIEDVKPLSNPTVADYPEAELRAQIATADSKKELENVRIRTMEWITKEDAHVEKASATVRFDLQRQYTIELSQRLRKLEREILNTSSSGGHFHILLGPQSRVTKVIEFALPPEVEQTRHVVFTKINESNHIDQPVVALIDLTSLSSEIESYAQAYQSWLNSGDVQALRLDVVLAEIPEHGSVALIAPTHPLKLLWSLQKQLLTRTWTHEAWQRHEPIANLLERMQMHLTPQGLPPLVVLGPTSEENYVNAGPLPGGWEVYLPPRLRDSRALLAILRRILGVRETYESEVDIRPGILADKMEMFLRQHPYTPALVFNVINPGDATLIVNALVELEGRRSFLQLPPLRYRIRIFTDATFREGIGEAFQELANPVHPISAIASSLVEPGQSFLFPKLSWSRNTLDEFLKTPEHFPAHITLLMDAFPIAMRVTRIDTNDRSSFVYGLIQESPKRFIGRGRSFTWVRRPSPTATLDLQNAPGRSGLMAKLLSSIGKLQAQILAPNTDVNNATAVVALDLSASNQSLLFSAHAASTWVMTLDPHLGLDYFDTARRTDQPGYLLDFSPDFLSPTYRQLLLTTRIDDEIVQLMKPALMQLNLDESGPGSQLLIEALRSLSGRLAMQLLSSPNQVQGTLGMILSQFFLEAFGLLESSMIIPLDAHPEMLQDKNAPHLRGDLLLVTPDPSNKHLNLLLIETKCLSGTGLGANLREEIAAQLRNSDEMLRSKFDPHWQDTDRVDRALQSWQFTTVLNFYLDRAVRYKLINSEYSETLRHFINHLDDGYTLSTQKIGLVFRLDATDTSLDRQDPELPIWIIGRELVQDIVTEAMQAFHSQDKLEVPSETPMQAHERHLRRQSYPLWREMLFFVGGRHRSQRPVVSEKQSMLTRSMAVPQAVEGSMSDDSSESAVESDQEQDQVSLEAVNGGISGSTPDYDVLIGETKPTPQFGIIGAMSADDSRHVALDLNGCNTISVFGIQGSGKSYTVGTIIEMSTIAIPAINALPKPLGSVVFHFNQTQDYPPEFVSMNEPNLDLIQTKMLAEWGAKPGQIDDMLVLTTNDTIERRREEFPQATVEPITFSSTELTVADWRFLMGATSNDALYLKLLNEVMRRVRNNLTLQTIRDGITQAPLSDSQRLLAFTRLDFAARFINDEKSLRSLLRPGRLIIVDLRDEFVEKEQALGLFVTMLNIFAGAGIGNESFNKLIVFDEAHKYMGGVLSTQVIEAIREMRHKGVSLIIASQDPIHVAPAVIELSSAVIMHRFNSPSWLRHIQKSQIALSELTPTMLASLLPGEAYVWASKATDPVFTRRAVKVRMRPRVTKHGGSTRTALDC
jgi:DNA phosphorothioation-dependent restriction protein DptH